MSSSVFHRAICTVDRPVTTITQTGPFWRTDEPIREANIIKVGGMWAPQRKWWNLPNFIKLFVAGYGAGKTLIGGKRIIASALHNAPCPVAAVGPTHLLARRTIIATIIELLIGKGRLFGPEFYWRYNRSISEFKIRYHGREGTIIVQSGEDPLKLRGPNLAAAWIDEPFIQEKEVFDQMMARVRHPRAKRPEVFLTGCVVRDTLVMTDKGLVEIGDLDPGCKPKEYKSISQQLLGIHNEFHEATKFYNNGIDETRRVELTNGYHIEATPDHPILVMGEDGRPVFKRIGPRQRKYGHLGQLDLGDHVAIARGQEIWGDIDPLVGWDKYIAKKRHIKQKHFLPDHLEMTEDIAYFMGLWTAEGGFEQGGISITCGDHVIADYVEKGFLGLKVRRPRKDQFKISSTELMRMMEYIGMKFVTAPNKKIPKWVFQARREFVIAFISGMWDGDGHVCKDGTLIGYTSTSEKLIDQLQILLANFGVITHKQGKYTPPTKLIKSDSYVYQLTCGNSNARKLADILKLKIRRKRRQLRQFKVTCRDSDVIPYQSGLVLSSYARRQNKYWRRGSCKIEANRIVDRAKQFHSLSYSVLKEYVDMWDRNEKREDEEIEAIRSNLKDGYYWAEARLIQIGEGETVDFVIPDTHSFVSACLISTNTPEQLNWGFDLAMGELKERHDVGFVRGSTRDNPVLNEGYVKRLESTYDDKAADAYIDGEFVNLSTGMFLYSFSTANVQHKTIPEGAEICAGMDFNVNPMAAAVFWRKGNHIHFFDEIELANADTEYMCQILTERYVRSPLFQKNPLRQIFPDATGSVRRSSAPGGKTDFHYIRQAGFQVRAPHENPKLRDRYNAMNGKFKAVNGEITMTMEPTCRKMIRYCSTYSYEMAHKQENMSHLICAMGYPVSFLFPVIHYTAEIRELQGA